MRKKRIILKRSISALVIGAVTISILAGATSASSSVNADDATASVAVFENLLNDRSFVVDTFTQDTMPESNPYGRLDGVANTDYLSTDFLKQYENDPIFKSGVSLYYRMNHTGETISEIPSVLLDVFATDADWTKFCAGAKSKNYDSLLTSIYQNDYKSVSGNSIGSEEEGMQTLRAYSDLLDNSKTKDASKWLNDYLGAITDVNDIDKYNYLLKNTELYDENLTKYVSNVKKTLLQASKNSDGKKEMKDFSDLYEAQFYADYGAGDIPQKWDDQYKTMQIDKYGSKIKKIAKSVKTVISTGVSTVNNIVMMENLYRNQESMHDTLVRVRSNATKNNDNTFIRASSSYLSLLESDELGDNVIRSAALKSIYDYGSDELGKYVWDTAKGGVRDEAAIMVARKTGMDTLSSKMAVSAAVGRANAILAVGKDLINYGTGFDDVCEKIYLMKYLQEIKQYAVDAFNDDKNNYNKYKSQADMKNMDIWASAAIDDLQFIKRIVLLQNDLGYQTANAQIGSKYGEILSWIDGCNDAAGLEARYTNLQNALVDTTINPVSTNPISVDEGCTLQIIHSTDSDLQTYAVYTNRSGQKCSIAEFENVMLAGIRINGGTLKISDQSKEEMKFNGLFVTDKAGNLEITGNGGEIYVGRLDINGFLQINDKCSKKINVASNLNIRNYVSIKNMDIHVAGNCNVAGSLEFASSELVVDGNMEAYNGYLQMQDTEDKLLVKGNLTLGETYGSSKGDCLRNGTVEVKGDFTSNYKETGSNWYGYYETNMHKTIFSGEKTQKISFKEASQVNGFSDKLELQNNDINFATPIYNVKINQDTQLTNTEKLMITGTLNTGGYKFATTGNIDAERLDMGGAGVEIAGDVAVRTMNVSGSDNLIEGNLMANGGGAAFKQGSLEVGGNAEFNNGFLQMQDTEDKLLVKGNLALGETYGSSKGECLTNGTVEVKGDFTSNYKETGSNWYGYYETNMHKTIFSGEKTQKISFKEPSQVNRFSENLELQNNAINFATPLYSLTVNNDMTISKTEDLQIVTQLIINNGSFVTTGNVEANMLNINNTKENQIQGNLNMTGTVVFKKGSLEVGGNAKFDNGYLQMKDTEDKLVVKGNMTLGETYGGSESDCLTNGTVEVKGDFTSNYKETGSNWYGYYETNTHKTIFSGEKTQKINFKEASQVNGFSDKLELQNNDINFATPIYNVKINQDTQLTNTEKLMITGTLNTGGYKFATTGNIDAERLDMGGAGVEIAGDVAVRTMNVSGSDNLIKGNLMANGGGAAFKQGSLEVGGNAEFNNGFLQMQDTEDKLLVKGNLTLGETYGSSKGECLTNGTVEVKGDFTSNYKETGSNWYGYYETNMHKTIFSGEKTQKISFKEPSRVNRFSENLELQNTDINFATPLYSLTLNQDTVLIHTDLLKINEFLNLNGHKLATTGKTECSNVAENGGTLEENPKFGHNYYNQLKPADLKDHDIKYADEAWVCTSCGKIFTDAEGIVEYDPDPCKDGHTIVIDQGKAATCTTDGLTEGKHCSVCKTVLVPQEVIPASHNWEEDFTIDKEPSCTTEGRKSIHCKKCGETKDEQVIPATGHDFTEWETIAETSCTKEGITQRRCKICGFTETKKLDKKAHEWGTEYTVDQPATFAADGSKSIHCKNCETISEAIAIPRINSVKISATACTYSGGVKTPSVTVKDANGNALHNKTDYIVQYASGRKNVGTYKVIVTFKDNYSGKKTLSFTINPKGTAISSLSKSKKAFTAKWKKQSAQTSGYQLLYSTNSKFKSRNKYVTVSSYKTTSKTIKKLAAKKKYYVKIRTYRSVSGKKYYSGWSAAKTVVTK